MKIGIVTGASSGLGEEAVVQISKLYKKLDEIWVVARRTDRLEALQNKVDKKLRVLSYDVTDAEDIKKFKTLLEELHPNIRILANVAGFGKVGTFDEISYKDTVGMVQVNCTALVAITYLCLPYMKAKSRILQLASAAAFLPQAGFAVYAATKSFVLSFARGLNMELKDSGITVTAVCPGPVDTEFFDVAYSNPEDAQAFKKLFMVKKEAVIRKALFDARDGKEVSVYGVPMKILRTVSKVIPHSLILNGRRVAAKMNDSMEINTIVIRRGSFK